MMASARSRLRLLELEDLLLDGVPGDQAVGEDGAGLADAVGAVDGLGLDGGVPPGVEQEDVVGGGQVEAEAAGLEADQEELAVGIGLEALDPRLAVARLAVEVLVGDALARRAARARREEAGELREDQRLVALLEDLGELREEHVELGAGLVGAALVDRAPGWQAAWRRRSSASRTWIFDLPRPCARSAPSSDGGSGRAARRRASAASASSSQKSVCSMRSGSSVATCSLVRRRMNGRSAAAEQARPSPGRLAAPRAPVGSAARAPSMPGLRNSNRLQSSPRWFSTGVPESARRCSPRAGAPPWPCACSAFLIACASSRIDVVEVDPRGARDVAAERAVGGEDEVVVAKCSRPSVRARRRCGRARAAAG